MPVLRPATLAMLLLAALSAGTTWARSGALVMTTDIEPAVEISIEPANTPDTYAVSVTISEGEPATVLAQPMLIVKAGETVTFEMGADGSAAAKAIKLSVALDKSGKKADYTAEVRRNGQVVSSRTASVPAAR